VIVQSSSSVANVRAEPPGSRDDEGMRRGKGARRARWLVACTVVAFGTGFAGAVQSCSSPTHFGTPLNVTGEGGLLGQGGDSSVEGGADAAPTDAAAPSDATVSSDASSCKDFDAYAPCNACCRESYDGSLFREPPECVCNAGVCGATCASYCAVVEAGGDSSPDQAGDACAACATSTAEQNACSSYSTSKCSATPGCFQYLTCVSACPPP
jgi:hypothetical protein